MKHALKAVLTASALLAAPALVSGPAFAQATTATDSEQAPSAQKAEALKNQSTQIHNPTEQNKTYKNQMNEQPDPKAPGAPMGTATPTGQTSEKMPISSPQHEKASKHKHGMKGMKMSDKSAQQ
ncbi:hypothetical protein ACFFGF_02995 [Asaia lannensis]|uniref:Acid shock protein n=1 Tax=Asaia lannensis NBRC 102526 TaxID=1307926 RepID=A0ABT1CHD1_9PROT|nr:hypothetical protein [Asaia lannensis]MCO6160282.1 hypothetical protein [Asaia lannensis NBRC 102526]GBQ94847.1 hypothetical protein AA102526_0234 [Asaia lannensis NBRC 102526]